MLVPKSQDGERATVLWEPLDLQHCWGTLACNWLSRVPWSCGQGCHCPLPSDARSSHSPINGTKKVKCSMQALPSASAATVLREMDAGDLPHGPPTTSWPLLRATPLVGCLCAVLKDAEKLGS